MERKIVIIGMDNTGKTTLVNDMKNTLNIESIKSPGPNFTKEEMYEKIITDLSKEKVVILERFAIIEEMIYGEIIRHNSKFNFEDLMQIKEKYNPIFIYCRPKKENIFNFGDREQMDGVIEQSKKLLEAFDNLYNKMIQNEFDIFRYDYNVSTPEEMVLKYERSK